MRFTQSKALILLIFLIFLFTFFSAASSTETIISGLDTVWELAWGPNGDLYITERNGRVSRWNGEKLTVVKQLPVIERGESGLMGMVLDHDFDRNSYIYFCYTRNAKGTLENVVERFELIDEKLVGGKIVLEDMRGSFIHDGCRLAFDRDEKLLVTMGDSARASLAQDKDSLNGKVLRVNPDGSIPEDNPFPNSPVFTLGHRNPQGLDIRPGTEEIYISEHGPDTDDEINRLIAGNNYGWPEIKGTREEEGFEPALWDWTPTIAPAGIEFMDERTLYLVTLKQSKLHRLILDEDGRIESDEVVLEGYGRLRAILKDPESRCLYIGTSNRDGRGRPREGDDRVIKYCP